jgi:hypothetical protein
VSNNLGLIIEGLVAVLLLFTIGYSILLNHRLKRLRADEFALKATISELITATEIAERAVAGLKLTVRDCDQNLGARITHAERLAESLDKQVAAGEGVLGRVAQIVTAARNGAMPSVPQAANAPVAVAKPPVPDASATVRAAQAFAARMRSKTQGVAA